MKIVAKYLSLIALSVFLIVTSATAQSTANLVGKVTDTVGAMIPRALVVVHPDMAGLPPNDKRETKTLFTDAKGTFALNVKPGLYDVCVMISAFTPECRKLNVKAGQSVSPRFRLRTPPEDARMIADTVEK